MKFCCTLGFVHPDHLIELARLAEQAGFDTVTVADHVVHPIEIDSPYPYSSTGERSWDENTPWPDPFVAIAAMAAHTSRLRFSQGVFILAMRDPFTAAKAIGTCARMSGNRLSLGVGLGWMREEYALLGQEFGDRGARTNEMIEVLRKLWTGKPVEHHGRFYDFDPLSMAPGVEKDIPIIVGGISKAATRRVALLGDGWAPAGLTVEQVQSAVAEIHAMRDAEGRNRKRLEIFAACPDASDVDGYRRMEDAEISHAVVKPWALYGNGVSTTDVVSLDVMCDGIKRFADEVLAEFGPVEEA